MKLQSARLSVAAAAVVVVAMLVPPVLVVNAFRVLAQDRFVRYELGRDTFPPDRYGLAESERLHLALTGLHSIQPGGKGIVLLEQATLPDGGKAFNERELSHMADVRHLLGRALHSQILVLVVLGAVALALARHRRLRTIVPRGLLAGSLGMLGIAVLAVPIILLGFDGFFLRFHQLFFTGDTWRFADSDTLLRLYPEVFWQHTAVFGAAIVLAQALILAIVAHRWVRRARPERREAS